MWLASLACQSSGQSIVTQTRLGNPDPVRIITWLQNIYPVTGISKVFVILTKKLMEKHVFGTNIIFQMILTENLIFSQKMFFSGACGLFWCWDLF